jgi:hypothetical protein
MGRNQQKSKQLFLETHQFLACFRQTGSAYEDGKIMEQTGIKNGQGKRLAAEKN